MREKLSRIFYYSLLACLCISCLPALFLVASLIRLDDKLEQKGICPYED